MKIRLVQPAILVGLALATLHAAGAQSGPRGGSIAFRVPCASLAERLIPAAAIGLPTTGATLQSADLVPASAQTVTSGQVVLATPEYCRVTGAIAPVDPRAPSINFHVNLPAAWNGKLIQLGGSGSNGVIPVALTTGMQWGPESIPPNAPYAVSRGFVTYGSDSGHQNPARGAPPGPDWMLNDEALTNFAYAQLKKTHDVTLVLVDALYGRTPRRSYFMGSSQGGREAMMAVQRFPADYDGVFSQVPVLPYVYASMIEPALRSRSQIGDAWIPPSKLEVIAREVRRQCDTLDGLEDGLVSNYVGCNAKFDPTVTPGAFASIRCADGKDTGDTCLSDAQITAVNQVHATTTLGFSLAHDWSRMAGWPTGSELPMNWKLIPSAPTSATTITGSLASLVVRDPTAKIVDFSLAAHQARLGELSALLDATDPDLSAFQRRGGKLILKVNTTDYTVDPRWIYAYYDRVVSTMTPSTVDAFLRFYVGVGIFHNRNIGRNPITDEIVPAYVDFIAMLDDWVEAGKAPADVQTLSAMDTAPPFTVRATFPLCRYPLYPRYQGKGDAKTASSYACTRP